MTLRASCVLLACLLLACDSVPESSAEPERTPAPTKPATDTPPPAGEEGRPSPPRLSIAHWINTKPIVKQHAHGKVVLVDFWAVLCGPCRRLMPRLEKLHAQHKHKGLLVVGVTDDAKEDAEKFARSFKITYPLGIDDQGKSHDAFAVKRLPTCWLVGRDGRVAWKGPTDKLPDQAVLAELNKKPPPKTPAAPSRTRKP